MSYSASISRRFGLFAAVSAMLIALFGFAFAVPNNAQALSYVSDDYIVVTLGEGSKTTYTLDDLYRVNPDDPTSAYLADPSNWPERPNFEFASYGKVKIQGDINFGGLEVHNGEGGSIEFTGNICAFRNVDITASKVTFDKQLAAYSTMGLYAHSAVSVKGTYNELYTDSIMYAAGKLTLIDSTLTVAGGTYSSKNGSRIPIALYSDGGIEVNHEDSSITATGYYQGIRCNDLLKIDSGSVTAKATSTSSTEPVCGAEIYEVNNVCGTLYASAPRLGLLVDDLYVRGGKTTGKATTKSKITAGKSSIGIKAKYVDLSAGAKLYGYAYAPKSTNTQSKISDAMRIDEMYSLESTVYAYNSGKYGNGLWTKWISLSESTATIKAPNYGIGIYASAETDWEMPVSIHSSSVTIRGGKTAIRNDAEGIVMFTESKGKIEGKNAKGTRTGNGIISKGHVGFTSTCKMYVYAKTSSSYYGIRSTGGMVAFFDDVADYEGAYVKITAKAGKAVKAATSSEGIALNNVKVYRGKTLLKIKEGTKKYTF